MTARAHFSQADVTRILKAARAAGYGMVKLVVTPTGALEVFLSINGEIWDDDMGVELV